MHPLIGFLAGAGVAWGALNLPERLVAVRGAVRLDPTELEARVKWGGLIGALTLLLYLGAFALCIWTLPPVLRYWGWGAWGAFFMPLTFLLTMDLAVGISELAFDVAPVSTRPIIFEIGDGVRRRGAVRLVMCLSGLSLLLLLPAL